MAIVRQHGGPADRPIEAFRVIDVAFGSFATEAAYSAVRRTSASSRKLTSGANEKLAAKAKNRHHTVEGR